MNKKLKYIGISGVARSGKNLFADILIKQLKLINNMNAVQFALANELKQDCASFISDKCQINVFTEDTKEKILFRDMLVWYGDLKRKQSAGRYWIKKLNKIIDSSLYLNKLFETTVDIAIISDIRYDVYANDEADWVQKELNGSLVHISKYQYGVSNLDSEAIQIFTQAANLHEESNNPRIREKADFRVEWQDIKNINNANSYEDLLNNEYLNNCVIQYVTHLNNTILAG